MANYTGNKTWETEIYIIDPLDPIAAGVNGEDSKPNVDLQNRFSYIKKFKGTLVQGNGLPSGSEGLVGDVDVTTSTLYMDLLSGNFHKPTDSSFSSWTNVTANVILNIQGIKINNNGNDNSYSSFDFNNEITGEKRMDFFNQNDKIVNIQAGNIQFESAEGYSLRKLYVSDSELQLLTDISQESENANAQFGTKVIVTPGTGGSNNSYLKWNETRQVFELVDENGDELGINISQLIQQNVASNPLLDIVITNQTEFNDIFNTAAAGGTTTITDPNDLGDVNYSTGTQQNLTSPLSNIYNTAVNFVPCESTWSGYIELRLGGKWWLSTTDPGTDGAYQGDIDGGYGAISFFPNGPWDTFAGDGLPDTTIYDGLKTMNLPNAGGSSAGGYFQFYYNRAAFISAFYGLNIKIVISQSGNVYKNTISQSNLVIKLDGTIGPSFGGPIEQPYHIFIKKGNYNLINNIIIARNDLKIECHPGATMVINMNDPTGSNSSLFDFDTGSTGTKINNVELILNINGDNGYYDNVVNISNLENSDILLSLQNINITEIIRCNNEIQNNNKINIALKEKVDVNLHTISNVDNTLLIGDYRTNDNSTGIKLFNDCDNIIVNGLMDGSSTLGTGLFDS